MAQANTRHVNQQDVNKVAKYIYKNTDGAYQIKFGANFVDVYMNVYYHTGVADDPIQTMRLDINLTSYADKIRYNVTEMDIMENTFLHGTVEVKDPTDLEPIRKAIYDRIVRAIQQEFEDYDFIF